MTPLLRLAFSIAATTMAIVSLPGETSAQSDEPIRVPSVAGTPPVIDGVAGPNEWEGAEEATIDASSGDIRVRYLHDAEAFYVLYSGSLEASALFPEILIDPVNNGGEAWSSDDWWLHVSATDCESLGAPDDYSTCAVEKPDWRAVPNFSPGGGTVDTVEIRIPFTKLGLDGVDDTVGVAFSVTNTFSVWRFWPSDAARLRPSTWGKLYFAGSVSGVDDHAGVPFPNRIELVPNVVQAGESVTAGFNVLGEEPHEPASIVVSDALGNVVYSADIARTADRDRAVIETTGLASGLYVVSIRDNAPAGRGARLIVVR